MDYVTTGDGIITALHVLKMMLNKQKPLAELADCMEEFPQLLTNIDVKKKPPIEKVPKLKAIIKDCDYALGTNGRVIVRYSGTENKIRILVESSHDKDVKTWTNKISKVVKETLC